MSNPQKCISCRNAVTNCRLDYSGGPGVTVCPHCNSRSTVAPEYADVPDAWLDAVSDPSIPLRPGHLQAYHGQIGRSMSAADIRNKIHAAITP